ncbi:glycosyltransferase [Syntrophorhabdus aromaticivorans]|uniref:glycosyltransferase n=1 Tax=Syntrophorhabdus aromaticivorans TaxID=328301 RepID=UPI0018DDC350|nr:glycosyltransferase [Syntrophorhabdus aromaticivorans]
MADRGDIDRALRLIHDFVERIITDPLCTSQVFGSKTLDDLCRRIGSINLERAVSGYPSGRRKDADNAVFVYIVTKLQKSGGHTRVIEDFIKARQGGFHVVLSTELEGKSDAAYFNDILHNRANVVLEQAHRGNHQERLTWLQKKLVELSPERVYLFNHHQDSVAAAAIQPEMGLDAYFYHHGDHHLCLGVYLSHLKHIDPHPMGYHNCRNKLGIKNIYVPLTIEDRGRRPDNLPFMHEGTLTTCTAARSNKIELPYFVSYFEIVPKLLKTTGGRHIHIGNLSPWAVFKIRRGLKRYHIRPDRFVYKPWVPSVWKALHDYRVDLYIASFPYGGGLTLIEAMGAGIPVALHKHVFSRILSGVDLAYPGAFSWRYPEALLGYCTSLTPESLEDAGQLGRMEYEKFHSGLILKNILNDAFRNCPEPNRLTDQFSVETDEWALWMDRQLSISRVFFRASLRVFMGKIYPFL